MLKAESFFITFNSSHTVKDTDNECLFWLVSFPVISISFIFRLLVVSQITDPIILPYHTIPLVSLSNLNWSAPSQDLSIYQWLLLIVDVFFVLVFVNHFRLLDFSFELFAIFHLLHISSWLCSMDFAQC